VNIAICWLVDTLLMLLVILVSLFLQERMNKDRSVVNTIMGAILFVDGILCFIFLLIFRASIGNDDLYSGLIGAGLFLIMGILTLWFFWGNPLIARLRQDRTEKNEGDG
jgi:Kef-type K+ transport system membrane component KefB